MVSNSLVVDTKNTAYSGVLIIGREEGIRTLDTLFTYTRFPGVRLKPLIHLSVEVNIFYCLILYLNQTNKSIQ